jgi:glycosyltransferase involved in cell wall biosynthesis
MVAGLVSIVIPVYNREDLIKETLNSILIQSYPLFECIIIDDQSSDNTLNTVVDFSKQDARIKVFRRPTILKKGANSCRNFGFQLCQGEFILWFDSDDIMPTNSLKFRVDKHLHNYYDFVIGNVIEFSGKYEFDNTLHSKESVINYDINASNYLSGKFWFHTSAPMFRKLFLLNYDFLFDIDLNFHDETEFFTRLLLDNPKTCSIDIVVTHRKMHSISIKGEVLELNYSEKLLYEYHGYIKIFHLFSRNRSYLSDDVFLLYTFLFKEWIYKIEGNNLKKLYIFYIGLQNKLFDNKFKVFKFIILGFLRRKKLYKVL